MRRGLAVAAFVLALGACAQPGTQVPKPDAAKLDVAAGRISVACGHAEELGAFGGAHPAGLGFIESIAVSGARKLAAVSTRHQSDIYQGESVGGIVHDSVSLLEGCRLPAAQRVLQDALHAGH